MPDYNSISDYQNRILQLETTLHSLINKLDLIGNDSIYKSVFTNWHVRFGPYNGPTYEKELEDAKLVLKNNCSEENKNNLERLFNVVTKVEKELQELTNKVTDLDVELGAVKNELINNILRKN